jgi:DNA-directed RNA polymerase subunit H
MGRQAVYFFALASMRFLVLFFVRPYPAAGRTGARISMTPHLDDTVPTLKEMVRDRGFIKIKSHPPSPQNLGCVLEGRNLQGGNCFVHLLPEPKLGIRTLRAILNRYEKTTPSAQVILICLDGATSFTAKSIEDSDQEAHVCVFKASEVLKNITRHMYVPKHSKCCEAEVRDIKERWSLSALDALPKLSMRDPVSRYYKFRPGDVIRIHRKSHTHEPHDYYRVVTRE